MSMPSIQNTSIGSMPSCSTSQYEVGCKIIYLVLCLTPRTSECNLYLMFFVSFSNPMLLVGQCDMSRTLHSTNRRTQCKFSMGWVMRNGFAPVFSSWLSQFCNANHGEFVLFSSWRKKRLPLGRVDPFKTCQSENRSIRRQYNMRWVMNDVNRFYFILLIDHLWNWPFVICLTVWQK